MNRLEDFFSCYFHQDWVDDSKTADDVLDLFLKESSSAEELRNLSSEIRAFASRFQTDKDLESALYSKLGCYYLPSADGITAHEWMEHVARRLSTAADSKAVD